MSLQFWQTVAEHLQHKRKVFLALVAESSKHSPGTTGAKLLVAENGAIAGTIGGGVMEFDLVQKARAVLSRGNPVTEAVTLVHRASGPGIKSGLVCAGSQTNVYHLCLPDRDLPSISRAADIIREDKSGTLALDRGGLVVASGPPNYDRPQIVMKRGAEWRYEEQLLNFKRMAVVGGGHCGLALSRTMHQLGYEVLVYDTRDRLATLERNTFARTVTSMQNFADAGALIPHAEITFVAVMTPDYASDAQALQGLLRRPFPFIGVMGSQAKLRKIFRALRETGVPDGELSRLRAPVGVPMDSHTPEEISISIAAQVLQVRGRVLPHIFPEA